MLCLALGVLTGCATLRPTGPTLATPPIDAWAAVLHDRVDDEGRVDFAGIARDPAPLDTWVAHVAATSPGAIAEPAQRLAFLINSYNALAMYAVVRSGIPRRLSLLGRIRFFVLTCMIVGGRAISLYDYENDVIRPIGDARVHFALNCMSVSCPHLPRTPFVASSLDSELDAAARRFFSEPRNVALDDRRRVVRLSAILRFYTKDLLRHAPSLVAYVNRYRAIPVPADYKVEFVPYDWTINRQG